MKVLITTLAITALIGLIATGTLTAADFDGDSRDDIAIFRPTTGMWAVRGVTRVYFGGSTDDPAAGDYNGDGIADIGIFRADAGLWAIQGVTRVYFGGSSDEPVSGGAGGQRLYDYIVKSGDGDDLLAALESDDYGSVFIPGGDYAVTGIINVDNVRQITGERNFVRLNMAASCYLSIEKDQCIIEKIRVEGGGESNDIGNFHIIANSVTVSDCRSTSSDYTGFSCHTAADNVTFINCQARDAGNSGFRYAIGGPNNSRVVGCLAKDCNVGFTRLRNLSSCYVDSSIAAGFYGCEAVSACQAYSCGGYGFNACSILSACRVDGNGVTPIGIYNSSYISSSYTTGCTNTGWDSNSKVDSGSCNN